LAKAIVDPKGFSKLQEALASRRTRLRSESVPATSSIAESDRRSDLVPVLSTVPEPPDFKRHVLKQTPIDQIWKFINPMMLYGRHLGIKGPLVRELEQAFSQGSLHEIKQNEPKAVGIWHAVEEVKKEFRDTEILQPAAIFQFFRAGSQGNRVFLYNEDSGPSVTTLDFPRQRKKDGLCLADYLKAVLSSTPKKASEFPDSVGMFLVTVGKGLRALAENFKNRGDYLKSHILQALALESAEAYAELLHSQLRSAWGYPDPAEITMLQRFQAKYRGKRYSFGYPACPRLDDQEVLFRLLEPSKIGVQLTDGFMMDPEASVSALAFHHPQATYFSVGTRNEGEENV
jgi:5-methyltetrahydrofolate--homocysteine methyltransferase